MSEEAKVEPLDPQPSEASEATEPAPPPPAEAERKDPLGPELVSFLRKAVPAVWLLGAVVAGTLSGAPLFFLVMAAGVLALIVVLLWSSVQSLTGGATLGFEEALGMGAPSRAEEEKRAVLRALKDLEYERGVGKISPEDYAELSARYRAEAKRLMQTLDVTLGPARAAVEKDIASRLARAGITQVQSAPAVDPEPAREREEEAP